MKENCHYFLGNLRELTRIFIGNNKEFIKVAGYGKNVQKSNLSKIPTTSFQLENIMDENILF